MRIAVHEARALPAGLAAQVAALEAQAWPGSAPGHDPALRPKSVLLLAQDGSVLASLALLYKPVRLADGRTYRAAGLSGVVTRADVRGRGHGARLVAAARAELAADPAVDLALFSCDRDLVPFYGAAGFEVLPGTVLVGGTPQDPLATDAPGFAKTVLAAFFAGAGAGAGAGDDEGRTDQVRTAFTGIRVPLHPGTIDRLW
ncbi:GNAT family N-acetyltransferase [Streptomyces sp. NBC_00503]|uniref:GNAT family N-acetyltransferase n=1 Tax=Streptomyces sp. NBC_00503 TaxID=2903659 RepID=UPI002E813E85|nr:GNAT family N-acetyltransferase [Streptomyces sp. NBC_00503]WUD81088.1 GNAT family N-acetyltransferase [Streptomyces sp. NBC_00503]